MEPTQKLRSLAGAMGFLLIFLLCKSALPDIIHVPDDYSSIQGGIEAASEGDTVMVYDGIYSENINFEGKGIIVKSENGPLNTTIKISESFNPVVSFINNETRSSVLRGFTIQGDSSYWGIYIQSSSPVLYGNIINNHEVGIMAEYGNPIVRKNEIAFCEHIDIEPNIAGGIQFYGCSDAIIDSNIIHDNWGNTSAGINTDYCENIIISRNLLYSNRCIYVSGIKVDRGNSISIENNTIVDNFASTQLGTILIYDSESVSVKNNIVAFNDEWGICNYGLNIGLSVSYNDAYANIPSDYSGITPGPGSIALDPLFVDLDNYDLRLTESSPCIDAGDPSSPLDPDGTTADMGALFYGVIINDLVLDIGDVMGELGGSVAVPITARAFTNQAVGGLEFHIAFNGDCLAYSGLSSEYLDNVEVNFEDGLIHILWEDYQNPLTLPDSAVVLALQFDVTGELAEVCPITWEANCEMVDQYGDVIPGIDYQPGEVYIVVFSDISGNVVYYDMGRPVPGASVEISGGASATVLTDGSGNYLFDEFPPGDFSICPFRTEDDDGVTVNDVVLIRRDIVRLELFDTPYKSVAADVNLSGTVSVADVVKIRRYLAELDDLPSGNWGFIDAAYAIDDDNWPQAPRCIDTTMVFEDLPGLDFVAVRMGDVDNSWNTGGLALNALTDTAAVQLENVFGQVGSMVAMPAAAYGFADVAGLEMHLNYPADNLEFLGIQSEIISDPTINGGNGEIHLVWDDIFNPLNLNDGEEFLSLLFEITGLAEDSLPVTFSSAHIVDEYGDDFAVDPGDGYVIRGGVGVHESGAPLPEAYLLSQNYPNPFNASTTISYELPSPAAVRLCVYNLLGNQVAVLISEKQPAGRHQVTWQAADMPSGIYFYKLQAGDFAEKKKMVLLK